MSKIKIGSVVTFNGYENLDEGQDPVFEEGDKLKITKVIDDETYEATKVNDSKTKDSVFVEEVTLDESSEDSAPLPKIRKGKASDEEAPPADNGKKAKVAKVKEKKVPKAPAEEELEVLPADSYSEGVQKVIKSDNSALKAAKSLVDKIGENFWTLGGVLSFIRRHKSFKTLKDEEDNLLYDGKNGFANYVDTELGIQYRKAMYYIDIHEKFAPLGIDETRLLSIGWSKVKELTNVVTSKNVEKWLKKAEELGREDLQAEISTSRVKAGERGEVDPSAKTVKMTKLTFKLFEDQGKVALEAIEQAKEACGGDENAAFAHIVSEWLSLNSGDAAAVSIDDAFTTIENRYGLNEVKKYVTGHYKK